MGHAGSEDRIVTSASEAGFRPFDRYGAPIPGLSWKPLREGLTDRSIVGVVVSPAYADDRLVFAASLGGTIWRLRDA